MMANTCAYENIREQVISRCKNCSQQDLEVMKNQFSNQIKSARRLDNISTVGDLVRMLEKRNVLNKEDLGCLQIIAQALNKRDLLRLMNSNNGVTHHAVTIPPLSPHRATTQQAPIPVLNQHRMSAHQRIHELICNEIGNKWKDLARALSISEGRIDELEERYRLISDRVREILGHCERHYTNQTFTWFPLLNALGASRRNDLRIKVQQIIDESRL